jgi:metallo-beta-lactamase family protein
MATSPIRATFLGGARTVTGSKTFVETGSAGILVDCGLFQGQRQLRERNWAPFPIATNDIDAVVLTHAHIDHCGYLPRLHDLGYRGPVLCTPGTRELAAILLPDSGHLQEEEAAYANRIGYSRHAPAKPLYTEDDAHACLDLFEPVDFGEQFRVGGPHGIDVTWQRAGHILGAASIRVRAQHGPEVVFSGDLGRPSHPLLVPPSPIGPADIVVVESTYGDEEHVAVDPLDAFERVLLDAAACGGVVVVPAFAVDRTEVVLWYLSRLVEAGRVPGLPVFVDSPMATRALGVYRRETMAGSPEIRTELHGSDPFAPLDLIQTASVEESKALNARHGPFVVVSASGMATGGRVVHHLSQRIGDSRNTILLVGFQAPGTRGDRLRSGARELKMLGRYHQVRAKVEAIELSTHADRSELLEWVGTGQGVREVYVNHGEHDAARSLAAEIGAMYDIVAVAPHAGERVVLNGHR